jgi:hypothetical protein
VKGCVSDAPDGRQSSVWLWPAPGDAALVELFVAGAVDALFVVAVGIEPAPVEVEPIPVADEPIPELAARLAEEDTLPLPVAVELEFDAAGLLAVALLVELVATLSIVAPCPAVPADAAPALDDPPPVLGGVETVTVGVLVNVAPAVTEAEALLPVLVRVCPEVTDDDCAAADGVVVDGDAAGKPATPLPTWPWPPLPGVGPPTDSVVSEFTVCAAAGSVSASQAMAETATSALMLRQHEHGERVPARWLRHGASATVAGRRTEA